MSPDFHFGPLIKTIRRQKWRRQSSRLDGDEERIDGAPRYIGQIRPGKADEYIKAHDEVWPELVDIMR